MKKFLHATRLTSYQWNIRDNTLKLSQEWFETVGMDASTYEVSNEEWAKRIHPEDRDRVQKLLQAHFHRESEWFQASYRYWTDRREWIWIEDCGQVVEWDEQGKPVQMMGFNRDATESMTEKRRLAETNEMLQLAADVSNLWIYCISMDQRRVQFQGGAKGENLLFGKREMELKDFMDKVHPNERPVVSQAFRQLREKSREKVDLQFRLKDNKRHWRWVEASGRWSAGEKIIAAFRDVDEDVRRLKELDRLANRDLLTGLFNRNAFERKLNGFAATVENQVIAVCDVDGLKILNDAFGHLMGDRMLRFFSLALDEVFSRAEMIARIGGDEFAIIERNATLETMEAQFRELRRKVERFDLPVQVGVSYGIAELDLIQDPTLAYKKAEDLMYRQKHLENFVKRNEYMQKILIKMQAKDPGIQQHAVRLKKSVQKYIADKPMEANEKKELILLAQFHDIGKLNVSKQILQKHQGLNYREKVEVKRHPEIGYRIARSLPELAGISHEVLTHHERWDGKGYPLHLKGEEIPYKVRLLALFDYYDSITHDRPYRPAVSKEDALKRIEHSAGKRFDPKLTKEFLRYMKRQ